MTTAATTHTITAEPDTATVYAPLNALDRCDRCGAQAYVRWTLGDQDIVMCGHHNDKNAAGLKLAGFSIHEDNRGVLTNKLTAAY
jgi:hypothetical protein